MNCGIIGCGRMGRRIAQSLKNINLDLSYIYDISQESLSEMLTIAPNAKIINKIEDMFSTKLNLLIIATTSDYHAKYIEAALDAGIEYIFCEKPVVRSINEYNKINKKLINSKSKIAVNHQMRFMPTYLKILELQTEYSLGNLECIIFNAGNFGIANNGTHYVEAASFLTKSKPNIISAKFDTEILSNPRGPQFKDRSGQIFIQMENGCDLIINAKASCGHGLIGNYIFRNGQIVIDELNGSLYLNARQKEHIHEPTTRYGMPSIIKNMTIEATDIITITASTLKSFIDNNNYPSLEDGFMAAKTIMAAYKSNELNGSHIDIQHFTCNEEFLWA